MFSIYVLFSKIFLKKAIRKIFSVCGLACLIPFFTNVGSSFEVAYKCPISPIKRRNRTVYHQDLKYHIADESQLDLNTRASIIMQKRPATT